MLDKFSQLFAQIKEPELLRGIIQQIFDKATLEPHFCNMYADLCEDLAKISPQFDIENSEKKMVNACKLRMFFFFSKQL